MSGPRLTGKVVVVTGAGVLCHFGDDLQRIEAMLREGCNTPFTPYAPGVATKGLSAGMILPGYAATFRRRTLPLSLERSLA